jgi:hypothetical protein
VDLPLFVVTSVLALALWIGTVALQLADLSLTASRIPQLSAYVRLRDDLVDLAEARLSHEQLDEFRGRLAELDVTEAARAVPAGRSATEQLWRGTPWRLALVVIALAPFLLLAWSMQSPLVLIALLLPAMSYLLALAAARASVAAAGARSVVHDQQRAEIVDLLDLATRSSRAPVAGLGDRVRRALQILREQSETREH